MQNSAKTCKNNKKKLRFNIAPNSQVFPDNNITMREKSRWARNEWLFIIHFYEFLPIFPIPLCRFLLLRAKSLELAAKIMNSWDFHEIRTKTIRQKYWNALEMLSWINCFSAQNLRFKTSTASTPYKVLIWELYHDPNIIRKFSQKSFDCSVYKSFVEIAVELHFWWGYPRIPNSNWYLKSFHSDIPKDLKVYET